MAMAQVMMTIGILAISFLSSFIFFYILSPLSKTEKKKQLEEIVSQLINFVIYIWLGKIITNIQVFIKDPLTILAYPSNSAAFYVAFLLSLLTISYKVMKQDFNLYTFLKSFFPVFLVASFVFEFIGIVSSGSAFSLGHLGILMVLLLVYMIFYERITSKITLYLLFIWSFGHIILTWTLPFTTVFGYIVSPIFFIILMSLLLGLLIYNRKKVL